MGTSNDVGHRNEHPPHHPRPAKTPLVINLSGKVPLGGRRTQFDGLVVIFSLEMSKTQITKVLGGESEARVVTLDPRTATPSGRLDVRGGGVYPIWLVPFGALRR